MTYLQRLLVTAPAPGGIAGMQEAAVSAGPASAATSPFVAVDQRLALFPDAAFNDSAGLLAEQIGAGPDSTHAPLPTPATPIRDVTREIRTETSQFAPRAADTHVPSASNASETTLFTPAPEFPTTPSIPDAPPPTAQIPTPPAPRLPEVPQARDALPPPVTPPDPPPTQGPFEVSPLENRRSDPLDIWPIPDTAFRPLEAATEPPMLASSPAVPATEEAARTPVQEPAEQAIPADKGSPSPFAEEPAIAFPPPAAADRATPTPQPERVVERIVERVTEKSSPPPPRMQTAEEVSVIGPLRGLRSARWWFLSGGT